MASPSSSLRRKVDGANGGIATRPGSELGVRFPMMKEFTHFHYDYIDNSLMQISLVAQSDDSDDLYSIQVESHNKTWVVRRGYEDFRTLDIQLHECVLDRQVSSFTDLSEFVPSSIEDMNECIKTYTEKFAALSSSGEQEIYCGTVLNFFEIDNRGYHMILHEKAAINIPAIAAARAICSYTSQANDELSLEIGDMVSVIDKPRADESLWWRGKKGYEVGFFPSECVEIIGNGKMTASSRSSNLNENESPSKPVLKRRGKLITFLRMFFSNRVPRATLKQSGIVKERVFGADLGEHLTNADLHIPKVVTCCCEVIEEHGIQDGIYRLTGVTSNIQRLRLAFDEGSISSLMDEDHICDMHSITAVLKMYFRELPNPLLTYQLYESLAEAVSITGEERIKRIQEAISRLPPPHYRTANYLFKHLNHMSIKSANMDSRNLAIVWSPNLMRSKIMEASNNGATMLHHISIQATVVECLIAHYNKIFTAEQIEAREANFVKRARDVNRKPRPSSIAVSTPSRLMSIQEAQGRLAGNGEQKADESIPSDGKGFVDVFHTVIHFGSNGKGSNIVSRKPHSQSVKDSSTTSAEAEQASSVWKNIFHRGRPGSARKSKRSRSQRSREIKDDITDSDIGHLSRRLQSNSANNLQELLGSSPPDLITRPDLNDDMPVCEDDINLVRSASHDSFFELPTPPACNLQPDDEIVETLSTVGPITPGVVMRPKYDPSALDEILSAPKATWKRTSSSSANKASRTNNILPDNNTQHSDAPPATNLNGVADTQICPLDRAVSPLDRAVSPLDRAVSPTARRRQIQQYLSLNNPSVPPSVNLPTTNKAVVFKSAHQPAFNQSKEPSKPSSEPKAERDIRDEREENPYEPIHFGAFSLHNRDDTLKNGNQPTIISHYTQPANQQTKQDTTEHEPKTIESSESRTPEEGADWLNVWDVTETRMALHQAESARVSRSFSTHASGSERSSRSALSPTEEEPLYANLSQPIAERRKKSLDSSNNFAVDINKMMTNSSTSSGSSAGSTPTPKQRSFITRPRHAAKETDVDSAINNVDNHKAGKPPVKPRILRLGSHGSYPVNQNISTSPSGEYRPFNQLPSPPATHLPVNKPSPQPRTQVPDSSK